MVRGRASAVACAAVALAAAAAVGEASTPRRARVGKLRGTHHALLKGAARSRRPRALQEPKLPTGDDGASSLFDPDAPAYNIASEPVSAPTAPAFTPAGVLPPAVVPAPTPAEVPEYDQEFYQSNFGFGKDNDDPAPSPGELTGDGYYGRDNDDPPGGYSPWGSHNNYGKNSTHTHNQGDDTDFKEFAAFVGWYAFLILCCLLPTLCAYYRRRRNARAMRENFLSIQGRLSEIERRRAEDQRRGVEGIEVGVEGVLEELERESRERDWELLGQIFGPIRSSADPNGQQRRMVMSGLLPPHAAAELLGGVSALVQQERRRRAERGRRMAAALKGTSFAVRECHLIAKGGGAADGAEGDIEMGPVGFVEDEDVDAEGGLDQQMETKSIEESSAVASPRQGGGGRAEGNTDNSQTISDDLQTAVDAVPAPPQSNPISSLYEVHEPYEDDDDNQYTALCLPFPDQSDASETTQHPQQRLVPATCAICLLQYSPGCHVAWSSNSECTHVFHRDCILMWLLKKEEPLCPCCRRYFVSEAALNGDVEEEITDDLGGTTEDAQGEAGEAPAIPPPQDPPLSARIDDWAEVEMERRRRRERRTALNGEPEVPDEVGSATEDAQEVEDEASVRPLSQDPQRSV